ncbi:MAG: hypothetical protein ACOY7T_12450 [Pseudomonadota bacterium]
MLKRDAILAFKDKRIGKVEVPAFGGEVGLATLTAAEADRIRTLGEDGTPASVGIVLLGACDETGERLFKDDDKDFLAGLPAAEVGMIAKAILEHNGLTGDSQDAAKND